MDCCRWWGCSGWHWALNRRVPGHFRATVNSLVSLAVRTIFIGTGPLLGYALDSLGVTSTLLLAALFAPLIAPVLIPLIVRIRRDESSDSLQVVPAN